MMGGAELRLTRDDGKSIFNLAHFHGTLITDSVRL